MKKIGECPRCRASIELPSPVGEEVWVRTNNGAVIEGGVNRVFTGHCAVHGRVMVRFAGHHATGSEKTLKKQFNKADRKKLKQLLPAKEAAEFSEAIEGQRLPEKATVDNWLLLLAAEKNKQRNSG